MNEDEDEDEKDENVVKVESEILIYFCQWKFKNSCKVEGKKSEVNCNKKRINFSNGERH